MIEHSTLIAMVSEFDGAIKQISTFVRFLEHNSSMLEMSSLYRYQSELRKKNLQLNDRTTFEDQLSVAFKIKIDLEPLALFRLLKEFENEIIDDANERLIFK